MGIEKKDPVRCSELLISPVVCIVLECMHMDACVYEKVYVKRDR